MNRSETLANQTEQEPAPLRAGLLFPGQGLPPVQIAAFYTKLASRFPREVDLRLGFLQEALDMFGPADLDTNVWTDVANPDSPLFGNTAFVQPFMYTLSILAAELAADPLRRMNITPVSVAGHSLGEYEAATRASSVTSERGLEIVTFRGKVMQEAAEANPSKLVSIMGMSEEQVRETICTRIESEIALINGPKLIVVGTAKDTPTQDLEALAKENGARRVTELDTAGAFHTSSMEPAARRLDHFLNGYSFADTSLPFIGNYSGTATSKGDTIKEWLVRVMTSPVRWADVLQTMKQNVDVFVELGPGSSLASLNRFNDVASKATISASNLLNS